MKEYSKLYHIYYNPLFFGLRVIFVLLLLLICLTSYLKGSSFYPFVSLTSIILMFEIFFHFKIAKSRPIEKLSENKGDIAESMFLDSAELIYGSHNTGGLIKKALGLWEIKFLLQKANITGEEIKVVEININVLETKAIELATKLNKKYIQPSFIFVSYLLLTESQTKLLLSKDLSEADLLNILEWVNLEYPQDPKKSYLGGEGIADDWVFGWISETKKYMLDLTSQVLKKKRFFYPRDKEYSMLLSSISSLKSVILVGSPGSGKDSLIEQFVLDSFEGKLDKKINHIKVFQFLVDQFLAGASVQGEVEQRFTSVIDELSHSKDVVIFIENIETILGSKDFNFDISNALVPYLKESRVRIIGTATKESFKEFIEKKTALLDFISVVEISDPGEKDDLFIIFEKTFEIEKKYGVSITYNAVKHSLKYGSKYLPTVSMPGSAIRLLEDVSSSASYAKQKIVDKDSVDKTIQEKTNIPVSSPTVAEKGALLNLESEIHKYVIDQNEAVSSISEAIRRVRSGVNVSNRPTSFLFLGPTGVGKTQTAKVVSNIYFGGEKQIIRLDMSEYSSDQGVEKLLDSSSGSFLDSVFNHPYSLILLDEFEKANSKVHNLFLQIFDDGRLTDSNSKTVSFQNALIVATSNAGSEFIRENISDQNSLPLNFGKTLIDYLLKQNVFRPELLNRFDGLVVFKPLSQADILEITKLILGDLKKSLENQEIFVNFDNSVIEKVSRDGFDPEFGARPLRRFIQDFIEDRLSKSLLKDEIKKGDKFTVSLDSLGNLTFRRNS